MEVVGMGCDMERGTDAVIVAEGFEVGMGKMGEAERWREEEAWRRGGGGEGSRRSTESGRLVLEG